MTLPDPPPLPVILETLRFVVAPALGATIGMFGLFVLVLWVIGRGLKFDWRSFAPMMAVISLAAGLAAVNHFRDSPFPWVPDGKWWHWGWWAIGLAFVVELVASTPKLPPSLGNLLRGTAAGIIAHFVTSNEWQIEARWWVPAIAIGIAIAWDLSATLARRNPGGSLAATLALVALGAVVILIHLKTTGFLDLALGLATALAVLTMLAWLTGSNVGSAAAVACVPIGVLFLLGRALMDTPIPWSAFALVAFAPLLLILFLLPKVEALSHWRLATPLKVLLVALPVGWGVYQAMEAAPFTMTADDW